MLADVLDRFAIKRVIHQLEESTLRLITGTVGPAHPVEFYVILKNTRE